MPVAGGTEPSVVAGALAARVREGVEVALSAIGVDAVGNAMRAICFARLYLEVGFCHVRTKHQSNKPYSSCHHMVLHCVVT